MAERTQQHSFLQSPQESMGMAPAGPQQPPDFGGFLQMILQRLFSLPQYGQGLLPQMPQDNFQHNVVGGIRASLPQQQPQAGTMPMDQPMLVNLLSQLLRSGYGNGTSIQS
jgi:hypothetical protein